MAGSGGREKWICEEQEALLVIKTIPYDAVKVDIWHMHVSKL